MNLPNFLTICRFGLVPVYFFVFFSDLQYSSQIAFGILFLAGVTDILDGYLARKHKQTTQLGVMLDPLADKLMMLSVILSLLISGKINWSAAITLFIRDAGMIIGSAVFHLRGKKTVPANLLGKINTVLYYLAVFFLMFNLPSAMTILWSVILFSFVTAIIYILQFKLLNQNLT